MRPLYLAPNNKGRAFKKKSRKRQKAFKKTKPKTIFS